MGWFSTRDEPTPIADTLRQAADILGMPLVTPAETDHLYLAKIILELAKRHAVQIDHNDNDATLTSWPQDRVHP